MAGSHPGAVIARAKQVCKSTEARGSPFSALSHLLLKLSRHLPGSVTVTTERALGSCFGVAWLLVTNKVTNVNGYTNVIILVTVYGGKCSTEKVSLY